MVYLMGRPRVPNAKTRPVTVKLSEAEVRELDARRKSLSRSTYLRLLFLNQPTWPHPDPVEPVET